MECAFEELVEKVFCLISKVTFLYEITAFPVFQLQLHVNVHRMLLRCNDQDLRLKYDII